MQYDLVIIGTTVAALGLAKTVKQDLKTLIINPTEMVAYEYMNTYKLPDVYSKGAEYYKKFQDLGADILLNTEVSKIHEEENDTYWLEVFTGTSVSTVKATTIVDTTVREADVIEKSLNCLLVNKPDVNSAVNINFKADLNVTEIDDAKDSNDSNESLREFFADITGVSFVHQPDENLELQIMKLECPVEMSMLDARHKLIDFWRNRPQALHAWKIANIAFGFEYKLAFGLKEVSHNYTLLPSAYYNTPEESFQAGVELGRRLL
ncbi:MAG: hypothetical protein GX815_06515 [Clostridiales bacterium]|nr:hypothetical protein [Clostridiales bacterium]